MRISREADYAIRCLLFMAATPRVARTVAQAAPSQGIPPSFLAKILQKLARAGILSSARGARGGYRFRKDPRDVTVLSVIEAIEGPVAVNDCLVEGATCSRAARCAAHLLWRELQGDIADRLGRRSIGDLHAHETRTRRG